MTSYIVVDNRGNKWTEKVTATGLNLPMTRGEASRLASNLRKSYSAKGDAVHTYHAPAFRVEPANRGRMR